MKHTEYIIPIGEDAQDYDEMFIGVIRRQPELVRCKDCKHHGYGYFGRCPVRNITSPNDFCAWAERKREKENG